MKAPCDSKRRIHHPHKNIAVEKALAPSGVQVRKRFARRYFVGRFAGGLQFLHTIARHNQHVPKLGQIGFVAQRATSNGSLPLLLTVAAQMAWINKRPTTSITAQVTP